MKIKKMEMLDAYLNKWKERGAGFTDSARASKRWNGVKAKRMKWIQKRFYMKRIYLLKMYIIVMRNVVLELPDSFQVELLTKD